MLPKNRLADAKESIQIVRDEVQRDRLVLATVTLLERKECPGAILSLAKRIEINEASIERTEAMVNLMEMFLGLPQEIRRLAEMQPAGEFRQMLNDLAEQSEADFAEALQPREPTP